MMIFMTTCSYDELYKLRTATYDKFANGSRPCEICGRELKSDENAYVATDQGEYPIGSTCIAKARKAGLPIMEATR